jgi:glycerophosphoryl diester phosphodiesterase
VTGLGTARPIRFAHRGGGDRAPENTLAALAESIRQGVDALEFDVRTSADGVPVLMHDESVDRTTDGRGPVASMTLAELKRLDAGSWFDGRFRGERIPSLEDVLALARGRCGVNIEIKIGEGRNPLGPLPSPIPPHLDPGRPVNAVLSMLARVRFREMLIVSSFEPRVLTLMRSRKPEAHLGVIAKRSTRGVSLLHRRIGIQSLHMHARLAGPRRMRAAHHLGLAVFVWPVTEMKQMRRLWALGVDGIMCPDPALFGEIDEGNGLRRNGGSPAPPVT